MLPPGLPCPVAATLAAVVGAAADPDVVAEVATAGAAVAPVTLLAGFVAAAGAVVGAPPAAAVGAVVAGFGVSVAVLPPQAARMAAAAPAVTPPRKPRRE